MVSSLAQRRTRREHDLGEQNWACNAMRHYSALRCVAENAKTFDVCEYTLTSGLDHDEIVVYLLHQAPSSAPITSVPPLYRFSSPHQSRSYQLRCGFGDDLPSKPVSPLRCSCCVVLSQMREHPFVRRENKCVPRLLYGQRLERVLWNGTREGVWEELGMYEGLGKARWG